MLTLKRRTIVNSLMVNMAILINKYDIETFENPMVERPKEAGLLSRIKRWIGNEYSRERYQGFNNIQNICKKIVAELPEDLQEEVKRKGFFIKRYHPYLWNSENFKFYWLDVHNPSEILLQELNKHYRSLAFSIDYE